MVHKRIYVARWFNGNKKFKDEKTVFDWQLIDKLFANEIYKMQIQYAKKAKINIKYGQDIIAIDIDIDNIIVSLRNLKQEVLDMKVKKEEVDYGHFFDMMDVFKQICTQLKNKHIWNETAMELNKRSYDKLGKPFTLINE